MSYFSNSAAMAVRSGVSVRDNASSPSLSQRTGDRAPGVIEEVVPGDPSASLSHPLGRWPRHHLHESATAEAQTRPET
jgi:hypothetical protein